MLQIDLHTLGEHLNDAVVVVRVDLEKAGHILLQQFVTELRILAKRGLLVIPNGQDVAVISAINKYNNNLENRNCEMIATLPHFIAALVQRYDQVLDFQLRTLIVYIR